MTSKHHWDDLDEFMSVPMREALNAVRRMNDYVLGGPDPFPKKCCSMCGGLFCRAYEPDASFRGDMCRPCMEESLCEDYSGGDGV